MPGKRFVTDAEAGAMLGCSGYDARTVMAKFMLLWAALAGLGLRPAAGMGEAPASPREDFRYEVISSIRQAGVKCSLDVRLDRKLSKEQLNALGLRLRNSESGRYPRLFITYYLTGMTVGAGAWATTHFNPDIEVKILGVAVEEENAAQRTRNAESSVNALGQWVDEALPATIILRRKAGRLFMEYRFRDGSLSEKEIVSETVGGRARYREKARSRFGEYYVIEASGDLAIYDRDGLIRTARKLH